MLVLRIIPWNSCILTNKKLHIFQSCKAVTALGLAGKDAVLHAVEEPRNAQEPAQIRDLSLSLPLFFGYYEIIGYVMNIFMTRQLFDICRWDVVVCQSLNHSFTTKHFLSKATFCSVLFLVFSFPCFCLRSSTEVIAANIEFFREEAKEQATAHLLLYELSVKVLKVKWLAKNFVRGLWLVKIFIFHLKEIPSK